MKVKELKELLNKYPDDMTVLVDDCSDYATPTQDGCIVIEAVDKKSWYMRTHPTMNQQNKDNVKECLLISG